jgi:hypothetical protein
VVVSFLGVSGTVANAAKAMADSSTETIANISNSLLRR